MLLILGLGARTAFADSPHFISATSGLAGSSRTCTFKEAGLGTTAGATPNAGRKDDCIVRTFVRTAVAALLLSGAVGFSTGIARADHTPTPFFLPPPGCTGDWNTAQAAANNNAPGTSPGCVNHTSGS
jgi:hypothetical protein